MSTLGVTDDPQLHPGSITLAPSELMSIVSERVPAMLYEPTAPPTVVNIVNCPLNGVPPVWPPLFTTPGRILSSSTAFRPTIERFCTSFDVITSDFSPLSTG